MRATAKNQEWRLLGGLLSFDLLLGVLVVWRLPFQAPTAEYLWPAIEFGTTHHIASTFLSVGYSVVIGLGYMITGSKWGISGVDVVISLLMIAAAWSYLRLTDMTVRQTFCLTALLSLYPDFLLSYHKVEDLNLTALLLFSFLAAVLLLGRVRRWGYPDFALSFVLAAAVLVRPNLVLLVLLAWFFLYKFRLPGLAWRAAAHIVIIAFIYMAFTAAVHGHPFTPQNGPYNLYAGANQFTAAHIANPEDSLYAALAAQGITATVNWPNHPNMPEVNDLRDTRYEHLYSQSAWRFIRSHPVTMARLTWSKFVNLMSPDLKLHRARSVGGLLKILEALAIPLWFVSIFVLPHPGPRYARLLVAATIAVTLLPFLLTVGPVRFRIPLDFVCWMDFGAVLVSYRCNEIKRSAHAAHREPPRKAATTVIG